MENNKLIAEFMDYDNVNETFPFDGELHYHNSWNWLMPVIQRCKEQMRWNENNAYEYIQYSLKEFGTIDETYLAVVLFIEKHNKNNNNA